MTALENMLKTRPVSYWVTVASVVMVAAVAAVISYSHITDIALAAGESWRAYLIPWTFDGVVLAASMTMMIRRSRKLSYGWLPVTALGVGVIGSIVANIANALTRSQTILGNHGVAVMLAGFVPLAFLGCFHMLLGQHALVSIRPDNAAPGVPGDNTVNPGITGDGAGKPLALDAQPGQLGIPDYSGTIAPVPGFAAVQGPSIPTTGRTGPVPSWQVSRADRTGPGDLGINGGVSSSHAVGQPSPGQVTGNGSIDAALAPGRFLALLPPLAKLEVRDGKSVNGHSSDYPSSPDQTHGSPDRATNGATPAAADQQQPVPASPPESVDVPADRTPGDLNRYLDDELYVLAAQDGLTLSQVSGRRAANGSPPASRSGLAGTERQSLPTPRQSTDGKPLDEASAGNAHPTPATRPPRTLSPEVPAPARASESSDQPPTNEQILAYLDTHTGITVRQAATNLGVSESTVYRAKRARTQAVTSS